MLVGRKQSFLLVATTLASCLAPLDPEGEGSEGIVTVGTASSNGSNGPSSNGSGGEADSGEASSDPSAGTSPSDSGNDSSPATSDDGSTGSSDHPPTAPDGYYVVGNTVYGPDDQPHLFRGIARPSLEWNPSGESLSAGDYELMTEWGANVVRLALNQGFWLQGSSVYDSSYPAVIDQQIGWAHDAGLDVILDLHWSDRGDFGTTPAQQRMADANSIAFWTEVATRYQDDGRVIFELYNEPHDIPWSVWRDGGPTGEGWDAAGMQQLYDAVRDTGAKNVVIAGGVDWAYDLSGLPGDTELDGYNIMYATHPYDHANKQPDAWQTDWGFLTDDHAIIASEFGGFDCDTSYTQALIDYAETHAVSWTGWAWYPGGCDFPGLIEDWNGTPSATGSIVRDALLAN